MLATASSGKACTSELQPDSSSLGCSEDTAPMTLHFSPWLPSWLLLSLEKGEWGSSRMFVFARSMASITNLLGTAPTSSTAAMACSTLTAAVWRTACTVSGYMYGTCSMICLFTPESAAEFRKVKSGNDCSATFSCSVACSCDSCTALPTASPAICCTSSGIVQSCRAICSVPMSQCISSRVTLLMRSRTTSLTLLNLLPNSERMMSGMSLSIATAFSALAGSFMSEWWIMQRMAASLCSMFSARLSILCCSTSSSCSGMVSIVASAAERRCPEVMFSAAVWM
mmetsp:Transcript_55174/g.176825  ORF Transcript_55174/g.176825 Transcript_55174/m.176825 type:complete len:283 (-) Transcript_55174:158-1006(-)